MQRYSNVDVICLDDRQIKAQKGTLNILLRVEQKKYAILVNEGKIFVKFISN